MGADTGQEAWTDGSGSESPPGVDSQYDDPAAYDAEEGYGRRGIYPPDWPQRRQAIWRRQDDACGRCGRPRGTVGEVAVHHVRPLSFGGSNALENLVGLCGDCHTLMHPDNTDMVGKLAAAPIFPAGDALPAVAVVRDPSTGDSLTRDLRASLRVLEGITDAAPNTHAHSYATLDIPPEYARRLPEDIADVLALFGVVAEASDYCELVLTIRLTGLRGLVTRYVPTLDVDAGRAVFNASAWEKTLRTRSKTIRVGENASKVTISVAPDRAAGKTRQVDTDGATTDVTVSLSPPPLLDTSRLPF